MFTMSAVSANNVATVKYHAETGCNQLMGKAGITQILSGMDSS